MQRDSICLRLGVEHAKGGFLNSGTVQYGTKRYKTVRCGYSTMQRYASQKLTYYHIMGPPYCYANLGNIILQGSYNYIIKV